MALIDLTAIPVRDYTPMPFNRAGVQRPAYGASFRIDRLGSRWQFHFATPMMKVEPDCRRWMALLDEAEREGGLFRVPQSRFAIGAPGSPVVDANTAAGRIVPVTGATPHYAVRSGQWVSLVVDGQRYADKVAEQVSFDAAGEGSLTLTNLLRAPLTAGDTIELGTPKIEGDVEVTARPPIEPRHRAAIEWTVTEVR